VGLVISSTYKRIFPQYKPEVIMTDLKEALDLLEYNRKINRLDSKQDKTHIKPLKWGESKDVQLILKDGPIDFVIASDVLYEPTHFSALVSTLDHLVVSQQTCVYLGYKKRGLSQEQESKFFNICSLKFEIVLIQDQLEECFGVTKVDGWIGGGGGFSTILKETGVQIYKLTRKSAIL
jgi:predicted nicotinamide N-methyase